MNADELEATKALAARLAEWGVDGAPEKARAFVADMVKRGWTMDAKTKTSRRPPPTGSPDECRTHPGEWRVNCRCCSADRKAQRDEAEATSAERRAQTRAEVIATMRADLARIQHPSSEESTA